MPSKNYIYDKSGDKFQARYNERADRHLFPDQHIPLYILVNAAYKPESESTHKKHCPVGITSVYDLNRRVEKATNRNKNQWL